ncbi:hypothetical protein P0F65_18735 [Sphingomonas sp. I4]
MATRRGPSLRPASTPPASMTSVRAQAIAASMASARVGSSMPLA